MRIGIDARMIDNTGIGRYLRNLLIHLARIDKHNEYIVFINADNSRVVTQENFRFVPLAIPVPLYSLREHYWLPWEIHKWNVAMMHYPNFDIPLVRSYPTVVTIHDLIYYLYPNQCPSKIAHYYARFMLQYVTNHAHVLITDSEYSKQDLVKHFHISDEKIHVILPAADEKCCSLTTGRIRTNIAEKYGIEQPYILYVGKHHPYKNIGTLLQAYNTHREIYEKFQLVIAGKQDSRWKDLYMTAKTLNSGKYIVFTDFVPEEELFELYRHARLFVFPSLYEGFGLPPLEAMACGVPVISSNAASLPEVIGDAGVLVDPLNICELAGAIRDVLTNMELQQSLKRKGIRRAQQFSWEKAALQLLTLYRHLANC